MNNQKVSDEQITKTADDLIKRFKSNANEFREGKTGLLGFFVGKVMITHPEADPNIVNAIIQRQLDRISPFEKTDAEKRRLKELKSQFKNQL